MRAMNEIRFRVRYAETDQMGVVYHANYLVWMEMGRVELCRSLGVRYRDMEEQDGVLLTVVEARCRYLRRPGMTTKSWCARRVVRSTSRLLEFEYEMQSVESGQKLATGIDHARLLRPRVEALPIAGEILERVRSDC